MPVRVSMAAIHSFEPTGRPMFSAVARHSETRRRGALHPSPQSPQRICHTCPVARHPGIDETSVLAMHPPECAPQPVFISGNDDDREHGWASDNRTRFPPEPDAPHRPADRGKAHGHPPRKISARAGCHGLRHMMRNTGYHHSGKAGHGKRLPSSGVVATVDRNGGPFEARKGSHLRVRK